MEKNKFLSGDELVAKGITKLESSLPEIGVKDVAPNGSWLEQKQIQSALEARKHLVEVERVEKCGSLTHAEWREELKLAEVVKKVGGHWQFLGHNVGKQLFLKPEEALFLMEVNCLQLKFNGVTVSLQQAYFLLLDDKLLITHYKVYASLSRLGYKVFRHDNSKPTENAKKIYIISEQRSVLNKEIACDVSKDVKMDNVQENGVTFSERNRTNPDTPDVVMHEINRNEEIGNLQHPIICEVIDKEINLNDTSEPLSVSNQIQDLEVKVGLDNNQIDRDEKLFPEDNKTSNCTNRTNMTEHNLDSDANEEIINIQSHVQGETAAKIINIHRTMHMLRNKKLKPPNYDTIKKSFENLPDMLQKDTVTLKNPQDELLPKNVFLNNISYVLKLKEIRTRICLDRSSSSDSRTYSTSDEVNGDHVRRVRDTLEPVRPQNNWNFTQSHQPRYPRFSHSSFPNFWRPRQTYFPFQLIFQRPFLPNVNFFPRVNIMSRPSFHRPPFYPNFVQEFHQNNRNDENLSRKRCRNRNKHLDAIKRLAVRLKEMIRFGNTSLENIQALQSLIQTYNVRYKTNMRVSEDLEILENETIVETIDLDGEDESESKRRKMSVGKNYEANFANLKLFANRLREFAAKNVITSRHKRAFNNVIKRFNKTYKSEVHINENYEVIDRKFVSIDSSSDSDCVIEESRNDVPSGKLLKNPFNILKRLSEKQNSSICNPTTSKAVEVDEDINNGKTYSKHLTDTFNNKWLPKEDDFGRVELVPLSSCKYLMDNIYEYIYEFVKNEPHNFENWIDLKVSFLENISQAIPPSEKEDNCALKPIIELEDCTDMPTILEKLSIIPTNQGIANETSLKLDFDVYNRDVQNFKKSNRPKPHFRVVCINESSRFPSGDEVAALHSSYTDEVAVVFAIVGIGSVSYIQMTATDLPVYIPSNDINI